MSKEDWEKAQKKLLQRLVGRTIKDAFYEDADGEQELFIELDDGSVIIPMADPEGNGPGALHCIFADEEEVQVI
jgi:hypothetical protein